MTEPQTISIDHVRELQGAEGPGAILGLVRGRVEIIEAELLDTDDYRGALEVISRSDLLDRLGDDPTDEELANQADALTVAVQQLGG